MLEPIREPLKRMTVVLSWEEPLWRVYAENPKGGYQEGTGPSIEDAFEAAYSTRPVDGVCHIVHDENSAAHGMYRIHLVELEEGGVRAWSTDIVGLSISDGDPSVVFEALPGLCVDLISKQDNCRHHT